MLKLLTLNKACMNTKKNSIIAAAIIATLGLGAIGVHSTLAAQGDGGKTFGHAVFAAAPMNGLVEAIATKFNLNKDEVQSVFDEHHKTIEVEMHANHEDRSAEMLKKAVEAGDLTQEQADKLAAKQSEIKAFMESNEGKSKEDMIAAMEAHHAELKKWVEENNIPKKFMMFKFAKRIHGGPGMGGKINIIE